MTSGLSTFTRVVLLTGFYFVGGIVGKASAFAFEQTSLVWPPAGIALAAILLFGYRFWPGVAVGSLLCTFLSGTPLGFFSVATAIGNTMGAVTCAYLLERFIQFRNPLERVRDVAGFILLACLLGTTVNAAFNSVGLFYAHQLPWEQLFSNMMEWWVPNAMGVLVVAPIILAWSSPTSIKWRRPLVIEAAICFLGLFLGTQISFNTWFVHGVEKYPLAYLPYPFLVWAALRFGQRGATTGTLLVAVLAISELLHGQGPFLAGSQQTSVTLIGCYLGILAATNMLLASAAMEREKAVQATIESERRYRAVVEDQTDLICRFSPEGTLTFVNEAYCRFHHKKRSDLLGTSFLSWLSEQDREIPMAWFSRLEPALPTVSFDNKLTLSTGVFLWQQCTIRALFDEQNHLSEFQAVIQDITGRKKSEEAARIGEERLRAILDKMVDGVVVADHSARITSLNPAAEMVFGRKNNEAVGLSIHDLFDKPGRELFDDYLTSHRLTGTAKTIEIAAMEPHGATIPIDLAMSDISLGGIRLLIFVVRDISERKRMEDQFRQSQKMEAIGRLAGGIAHDFNNLLQAMLGYTDLLHQRLSADDSSQEPLQQIQKTVDRARSLTQQLLAFSRKQVAIAKVLSLNLVVTDMHKLLERLIGEIIRLEVELCPDEIFVCADRGQLEQTLLNLAINARDAMPSGGVLSITTTCVQLLPGNPLVCITVPPGDYCLIRISDTGWGMPPEVLNRLFEPFFTTKEAGKGTGLGLSIVYNIVQKSGGTITVNSKVGSGTTFSIYLPRVAPDRPAKASETALFYDTRGKETVLLVEDEELVLLMLTELLKAQGYKVLDAKNGAEALEIAAEYKNNIHLLVTDMTMPEVSGWELATRLEKAGWNLPVLYMSGYSDQEASERGKLHNCADFLQKPFQLDVFLLKVRQILDAKPDNKA